MSTSLTLNQAHGRYDLADVIVDLGGQTHTSTGAGWSFGGEDVRVRNGTLRVTSPGSSRTILSIRGRWIIEHVEFSGPAICLSGTGSGVVSDCWMHDAYEGIKANGGGDYLRVIRSTFEGLDNTKGEGGNWISRVTIFEWLGNTVRDTDGDCLRFSKIGTATVAGNNHTHIGERTVLRAQVGEEFYVTGNTFRGKGDVSLGPLNKGNVVKSERTNFVLYAGNTSESTVQVNDGLLKLVAYNNANTATSEPSYYIHGWNAANERGSDNVLISGDIFARKPVVNALDAAGTVWPQVIA